MQFKKGDRVRFIGATQDGNWNNMPREMVGQVGYVQVASDPYYGVIFDKHFKGYHDWSLVEGQLEAERPLTPFENKVNDYIRKELGNGD